MLDTRLGVGMQKEKKTKEQEKIEELEDRVKEII